MTKLIDITGKSLSREWRTDEHDGTGNRVLRTTNFTNDGVVDYNDVVTRKIAKKNLDSKYLRHGDIIIEKSGGSDKQPVGRVIYFEGPEQTYLFNNFTGLLRVRDRNTWLPRYVFYSLFSNYLMGGTRAYENRTTGLHNLQTDSYISSFEVRPVSIEKQVEICSNLDKIIHMISLKKKQISKLDELVKSRFVEMFESQAWERVRAGTILLNMRNGVSPSNIGTYPAKVLTLSAITQGDFNPGSWKDGMFDVEPPIEKRVTASDFYMCRGNGNKKLVGVGVYSKEDRYDLIFPDTAIAATVDLQRICLPYLFYAWQQPFVRKQIEAGARTTNGTYKINQGVVSKIELVLPPIELQHQFAAFVAEVDKSKLAVQQSLEKLETLKKSLMQQYFG